MQRHFTSVQPGALPRAAVISVPAVASPSSMPARALHVAGGALMTAYAYAPSRHRTITAWCASGGLLILLIVLTILQTRSQSALT